MFVVGVSRDDALVSDMMPRLCAFVKRCVIPELQTRHMQHVSRSESLTVSETMSDKLYCSCRIPANDKDLYDDMVGCDTHNCPHGEWFHFTCGCETSAQRPLVLSAVWEDRTIICMTETAFIFHVLK